VKQPVIKLNHLIDLLERSVKGAAKAVYRRPVIETSRLWRRLLLQTYFIGITGSAGKTTSKDLLHAALASRFRCTKNDDSNNQLYNVARTLLSSGPRTQFCVQEIGASERGGFDPMLALLKPQMAIVTNVGTDHLSAFRSREGVAAEKGKLVACLPADGLAVLNIDDDLVSAMASNCRARIVSYSLLKDADVRGDVVTHRWPDRLTLRIHRGGESVLAQTRLLGAHQAGNVLAAIAAACSLGVPLAQAALAVSRHEALLGRMSVHETERGITFIRDDGKAPLWSLPKAFEFMAGARATRKLIVLGTIADGGGRAGMYRSAVAIALAAAEFVLLVGSRAASANLSPNAADAERLLIFDTVQAASRWLNEFTRPGDLVLLKGSKIADHLPRLALAMDDEVRCWRSSCSRGIFCDNCRLIRVPMAP
jgi:UDP-N-acetylmuramoyl-tripeptide--D-alanyl-D-alanine ligase